MAQDTSTPISFVLNGAEVTVHSPPRRSALRVLREEFGRIELKPGCDPQGVCGTCVALVDGVPRVTCTMACRKLEGRTVQTVSDVPGARVRGIQAALEAAGATGTGLGVPSWVLHIHHLWRDGPPEDSDVERAMRMHTTRSVSWAALRAAATAGPQPPGQPPAQPTLPLGVADIRRPGMVDAWPALVPAAAGKITEVDVSGARATPGVVAVLTAAELPPQAHRERWLLAAGDPVWSSADAVALVVATTREAARAGANAVITKVAPREALRPAAYRREVGQRLHAGGLTTASATTDAAPVAAGGLEAEAAAAVPTDDNGLKLWTSAKTSPTTPRDLAGALGLEPRGVSVGVVGGQGDISERFSLAVERWTAAVASHVRRPARMELDLRTATQVRGCQPAMTVQATLQADVAGHFASLRVGVELRGGPTDAGVIEALSSRLIALVSSGYVIPHVRVDVVFHATAAPPAGAAPGLWAGPVLHALEGAVDGIADQLGQDRLDLRSQNAQPAVGALLDAARTRWAAATSGGGTAGIACAAEPPSDDLPGPVTVQLAVLGDAGALESLTAWTSATATTPDGRLPAALQAGLGQALTEALSCDDAGLPDGRVATWGLLKARRLPGIEVIHVAVDDDSSGDDADLLMAGLAPAAVGGAVRQATGVHAPSLPMRDSSAAQGLRRPRRPRRPRRR